MKRTILLFNLFVIASLQILFAQKLPFQGRLFENDMPVTGQVNLQFSISDLSWTETHSNVSVSEGLYSIDLGSITPLPSTLFFGVESRTLQVTVNGTPLEPISLYPSLTGNNFVMQLDEAPDGKDAVSYTISGVGTAGKLYRPFVGTSSVANGLNGGVTGIGISPVGNTNNTYGIFGRATGEGTGQNRGVYGEAISSSTSSSAQYGIVGRAIGQGTGNHYGVFGEVTSPTGSSTAQYGSFFRAQGSGTGIHYGLFATSTGTHDNFGALTTATGNGKNNIGIRGLASGTGNGETGYFVGSYNTGVQGFARSNSWGNTGVWGYVYNDPTLGGIGVDNIGVVGISEVNNGTAEMQNIGVRGQANGSGVNKGIVGAAFNGVDNWAGWFDGKVRVSDNLDLLNGKVQINKDEEGDGELFVYSNLGTSIRMYSHFNNDNTSHIALDGTGGNYLYLWGQGSIQASGSITATSVFETSDKNLKLNITPLNNSLVNVTKLQGVSFNWADASKSQEKHIGLIAQEVEAVYPEFVITDDKGVKAINYSQMVSVLIESIKELNAKVELLEEQNKALENSLSENAKLKQELDLLKELVLKSVQSQAELVQSVK